MTELDVVDELLRNELSFNAQAVRGAIAPEEEAGGTAVVGVSVAEVADLLTERIAGGIHCSWVGEDCSRWVRYCRKAMDVRSFYTSVVRA